MPADTSIWTFAGLTAAVGMGVVFFALFLLSTYMHFFKGIIARIESRGKAVTAPTLKPTARPAVTPAPAVAPPVGTEDARVAAAVAVGLHLASMRRAASGEVAAAIAVALSLHGDGGAQGEVRFPRPASGWKLAGRLEAMTSRAKRHERPVGR